MNTKGNILIINILLVLFCFSCNDIFETDLTEKNVDVIAPSDSLTTNLSSQKFWWNYMSGALWYELQVVSPHFSNVSTVRMDTILEKNNFQLTLQPGVYQWRVRAQNGSSSSEYTIRTLTINESSLIYQ